MSAKICVKCGVKNRVISTPDEIRQFPMLRLVQCPCCGAVKILRRGASKKGDSPVVPDRVLH